MKKVLKNIILTFLITFTILSIICLIFCKARYYYSYHKVIEPILKGGKVVCTDEEFYEGQKNTFGEDAPNQVLILSYFQAQTMGESNILDIQIKILIVSIVTGISIGILISLSNKSKIKEILLFIVIGLISALVATTVTNISYEGIKGIGTDFWVRLFEDFIKPYFIPYTIVYVSVYVIRYFINMRSVKELNNELKKEK